MICLNDVYFWNAQYIVKYIIAFSIVLLDRMVKQIHN